ncbi:hypothetical protein B7P43_G06011 [Cryptotermes secundus]|uniref:Uncharacterized protein n=1 Tax=Cryptotermes secundus TaxID=105785 RepID=A0A2J7QZD0_9NEOP|nr:hypothetical protein B7P43_G06011 [Cryptotermes secundus]
MRFGTWNVRSLISHNLKRWKNWKNYYSQLLNVHRVSDVRQIEIHTSEPLVPEVEVAIAMLKRHKLPGNNKIPAELIQAEGEILHSEICKLINSILNKEKLTDQWKEYIAMNYWLDGQSSTPSRDNRFFYYFTASWPALGPTEPLIQLVSRALSSDVRQPGREADHQV